MKAAFCGSFDPITNGHLDLIRRAASLFDAVVVIVAVNSEKKSRFDLDRRLSWVRQATQDLPNVSAVCGTGLAVDLCRSQGAGVLVRGLRNGQDLDYEKNMEAVNGYLDPALETVYLTCSPGMEHVSSSNVRELLRYGQSAAPFVPACVWHAIEKEELL